MLVSKFGSSPNSAIFLADDAFDVLGERVGFRLGAVVRQRDAEGRRRPIPLLPIVDRELRSMKLLKSVGLSIR